MGYPTTNHQHDTILVVVDGFSKMDILIPCKKTNTTQQTPHPFFEHVWKHYGLPTTIISDIDARFVSTFWQPLWQQLDTRLSLSTAFHPQTYGSLKSLTRTISSYVQPQASSNMGWHPSIHTTQLQSCSTQHYRKESIWDLLSISTLSAYRINQFLDTVERHWLRRTRSGESIEIQRTNLQHLEASIRNVATSKCKS